MDKKNLCPHCKQEVDPKASRCPHCQGKIYRWTLGRKILVGLIGFTVFYLVIAGSLNSSKPSPTTAQDAADLAAWQQSPAGQLCAQHTGWTHAQCTAIVNKKVLVGMSKEQAIAAWGKPKDINTTSTVGGIHEQWVYDLSDYLYFDNGVLSAIQN